jgi:hypothetical protein
VYVDDLNLLRTPKELTIIVDYLKNEFEMKDLGKRKFFLAFKLNTFQMEFLFISQPTWRKAHPLSTPMVVRSLDVKKDPFCPQEVGEEKLFVLKYHTSVQSVI